MSDDDLGHVRFGTIERGGVGIVRLDAPPNNYLSTSIVSELVTSYQSVVDGGGRAIVLCASGRHFCAGVSLSSKLAEASPDDAFEMYDFIPALFDLPIPVVAAVQGAAIGAGLGLAMTADFRVASGNTRFSAPFTRLGFFHGFGLSVSLPDAVRADVAREMLYAGVEVRGERAYAVGLCSRLTGDGEIFDAAMSMATELAGVAPLSLYEARRMMRGPLIADLQAALDNERQQQRRFIGSDDFKEGLRAASERRRPIFTGR